MIVLKYIILLYDDTIHSHVVTAKAKYESLRNKKRVTNNINNLLCSFLKLIAL